MRGKSFGFPIAVVLATMSGRAAAACQVVRYAELPVTMFGTQPFIAGAINGMNALFIADSGAFFSTLPRESAEKFNMSLGPLPIGLEVRGVGGAADARLGTAKDFSLVGLGTVPALFITSNSSLPGTLLLAGRPGSLVKTCSAAPIRNMTSQMALSGCFTRKTVSIGHGLLAWERRRCDGWH
jgi:hypothetical protein